MTQTELLDSSILDLPEIELSVRAIHCLGKGQINTLRDLATKNEWELGAIPRCGKRTIGEFRRILAQYGLHIGMTRFDGECSAGEALRGYLGDVHDGRSPQQILDSARQQLQQEITLLLQKIS